MSAEKNIRDLIEASVKTVFDGPIYKKRDPDSREHFNFVTVYIDSGELEFEGIYQMCRADLIVAYHQTGLVTDDALDEKIQLIDSVVTSSSDGGFIHGITLDRFEYKPESDEEFSSIFYTYTITYQR